MILHCCHTFAVAESYADVWQHYYRNVRVVPHAGRKPWAVICDGRIC